jgi:uncharacterized protein
MLVWIDIESPPHVQYLTPFKAAFEALGHEVVVTSRANSITLDLLAERGITPRVIDGRAGAGKARKVRRILGRAVALGRSFGRDGKPELLIATSRAAALSAMWLRIPSFTFCDYEFAALGALRLSRSYVFYPDVIDERVFTGKGMKSERLLPFSDLKEGISFDNLDVEGIEPHPLAITDSIPRVLVRPPGEETHYYVEESKTLALELLEWLSKRDDAVVVYSARYPYQEEYLDRFEWTHKPLVLRKGVPFVPLLKAIDLVISSGGTMLREAAYLGIPAYSIFRSNLGQVDRYLASTGRLTLLDSSDAFDRIRIERAPDITMIDHPDDTVGDITGRMIDITHVARAARRHRLRRDEDVTDETTVVLQNTVADESSGSDDESPRPIRREHSLANPSQMTAEREPTL